MNDVESLPILLQMLRTGNRSMAILMLLFVLPEYALGPDKEREISNMVADPELRAVYRLSIERKHKSAAK